MEPQQARMTFAVFMAFTLTIVFNALYFQKDAGFASVGTGDRNIAGADRNEVSVAGQDSRRVAGNDLLQAIRRELSAHNYFPGTSGSRFDQRADVMTRGAIMAWQYDNALPVTGLVSQELLKSFLFGVSRKADGQTKPPKFGVETRQLVAEIQGILSARGHYTGKIDGLFAKQTMAAIKRFESDRDLPVTGRISGLLVQELTRLTGVVFTSSK